MNTNNAQTNPIFRDQPLTTLQAASPRHASLYAACQEPSDALETLLRFCLVLCMLVALLIGGWHVSASENTDAAVPEHTAVAAGAFSVNGQHVF